MSVGKLFDISGRTALVTGGSRGLGLQIAEALGEMGARVAITARKRAELDEAVTHLAALGIKAVALESDLSRAAAIAPLVAGAIDALGPIDILVNNAGTTWGAATVEHPLEAWQKVLDLNLTAMFLMSQEVGRCCMVPRRSGRIINIASILGLVASAPIKQASYAASKGAVVNLTRELGAQWARKGVRVNAIAPGWFPSEMSQEMFEPGPSHDFLVRNTPMGRGGEPHELDGALLFLASDASTFVTGQILTVDGGWTAR